MQRIERLRTKKGVGGGRLWIPRRFIDVIPADAHFDCELVEEGILFRVVKGDVPANLPAWTNGHDS